MKRIDLIKALVVEVIRRLWDRGLFRRNEVAQRIHEQWFDVWADWKTDVTMRGVDRDIEEIIDFWDEQDKAAQPVFTERQEGETPLGGEMRLEAPWKAQEDA